MSLLHEVYYAAMEPYMTSAKGLSPLGPGDGW